MDTTLSRTGRDMSPCVMHPLFDACPSHTALTKYFWLGQTKVGQPRSSLVKCPAWQRPTRPTQSGNKRESIPNGKPKAKAQRIPSSIAVRRPLLHMFICCYFFFFALIPNCRCIHPVHKSLDARGSPHVSSPEDTCNSGQRQTNSNSFPWSESQRHMPPPRPSFRPTWSVVAAIPI